MAKVLKILVLLLGLASHSFAVDEIAPQGSEEVVHVIDTVSVINDKQEEAEMSVTSSEQSLELSDGDTSELPAPVVEAVPVETTLTTAPLEIKETRDINEDNKWILQYRYLGVLSQIGFERSLGGQFSAGLYYGRYAGKVAGTDKLGFIPGLEHLSLQVNAYLNRNRRALERGLVARFAVHGNRQSENELVKSVQVDGVDVIVPGQTRVGTLLGIGYQYNWKKLSLNAGMEYLTMGPLKSFVPLAIGVGLTF